MVSNVIQELQKVLERIPRTSTPAGKAAGTQAEMTGRTRPGALTGRTRILSASTEAKVR